MYIKNSDRFLFHKTNNKNKKYIFQGYLECFNRKNLLTDHKQISLSVNGTQSERLEKVTTEFKNHFQQMPVLFKVYADFECNLESVDSYEVSYSKKYQDHIPCSFSSKLVCVDDKFTKAIVVFRGENAAYEFIKPILKEYEYCKTVMKKYFNKDLIMSEEEEQFQSSNIFWVCEKLINDYVEKVRDHCHISGTFRCSAHWNCSVNLQLTKNVPVIFQNLRGYGIHSIFYELNKVDVKTGVIPTRLEKYMPF